MCGDLCTLRGVLGTFCIMLVCCGEQGGRTGEPSSDDNIWRTAGKHGGDDCLDASGAVLCISGVRNAVDGEVRRQFAGGRLSCVQGDCREKIGCGGRVEDPRDVVVVLRDGNDSGRAIEETSGVFFDASAFEFLNKVYIRSLIHAWQRWAVIFRMIFKIKISKTMDFERLEVCSEAWSLFSSLKFWN